MVVKKERTKSTTNKNKTKKIPSIKREPNTNQLLKKVAAVSDSTKTLSKEIKSMTKVFADNQKILVSMKKMIDTLGSTMEQIQKQSKQINIIEEDTQRLFSGLNEVKANTGIVTRLNEQTNSLQEKIKKIEDSQKTSPNTKEIIQSVTQSADSIRNNSKMIMKIADRVDDVKEQIKSVSSKTISSSGITNQIDELRKSIQSITNRTGIISEDMSNLKNEISGIIKNPDAGSVIGDGMKTFKSQIEEKISSLSNIIDRSDELASEFHKKTDKVFQELQGIKNVTNKTADDSSKEVIALLKLSEYQSNIRMQAESKYGEIKDIEKMTEQTTDIVNLFDKLSIEANEKIPLPHEVRQWAIGKIFDCADKWELRFSDVFNVLKNNLGNDLLKETIRIKQVRDIFGIRAVDEVRNELNIS
jgi:chromosome segregation ATPase